MELYRPGFVFTVEHLAADGRVLSVETIHNIMPTAGLNYMLGATFKGDSQYTTWYLGLFGNSYAPVASDTMASFIANAGENKAYTGTARPAIVFPSVANGSLDTLADPNVFSFATAQTIMGAFITTGPTWDATTGLLMSAVQFPSAKSVGAGESLRVPVGFALASV